MLTPSTSSRFWRGYTSSTRPRRPLYSPRITTTVSLFRMCWGVPLSAFMVLYNLRRERKDANKALLAQFAGHRTENACAARFFLRVDQHGGVAVEPDRRAVR